MSSAPIVVEPFADSRIRPCTRLGQHSGRAERGVLNRRKPDMDDANQLRVAPAPARPGTHGAAAFLKPPGDEARRRLLQRATEVVGGIGVIATAYPFVASLEPSERARAEGGPVEAAWGDLPVGVLLTVAWRGQPVWLLRRSREMIAALREPNPMLADPDSTRSEQPTACRNSTRSLSPELFVAVGICTHLGCTPGLHLGDSAFDAQNHALGGFLCPCHGSRFDLAGRVVRNVPAPTNLTVPPYAPQGGHRVLIGS